MLILFVTLLILSATVQAGPYLNKKPSFLKQCQNDSKLNACLSQNLQAVLKQWKDGVPGLGSSSRIDPMLIKRVNVVQNVSDTFALNLVLRNVKVRGASKAIIKDLKYNQKFKTVSASVVVPKLRFETDYKVKGHILSMVLNGNGKATFQTDDAILVPRVTLKKREAYGQVFADVKKVDIQVKELGGFHIQVNNLFGGQKNLEDSANRVFNENWRELYAFLRPTVERTLESIFQDRLHAILRYVPSSYLSVASALDDIESGSDQEPNSDSD